MASVVYNKALQQIAAGVYDLDGDDIRARLVMTDTTCDTENDGIEQLVDFTAIDVADATGYSDIDMDGLAVNLDDGNNRAEFDANDLVFSGLSGNATRDYQGVLLYKRVDGTNTNDLAIAFIDFTADVPKEATQVTVPWDEQGILQFAQAA